VAILSNSHNSHSYTKNQALIQEPMASLTIASPLLDSIALIGKNGEYYSLFTNTLKRGSNPASVFDWDLASVHGITWLPLQKSPYIKNNDIIPVIIPITPLTTSRYLNIADSPADADLLILLMLDSKNVSQRLSLSLSSYAERTLYIANSKGCNLSLPGDAVYYPLVSNPEIAAKIAAAPLDSKLQ
ncbi:MAG: hypothetical protein RR593_11610, partial [Hungatella sp.]